MLVPRQEVFILDERLSGALDLVMLLPMLLGRDPCRYMGYLQATRQLGCMHLLWVETVIGAWAGPSST